MDSFVCDPLCQAIIAVMVIQAITIVCTACVTIRYCQCAQPRSVPSEMSVDEPPERTITTRLREVPPVMYQITRGGSVIHLERTCPTLANSHELKELKPCAQCLQRASRGHSSIRRENQGWTVWQRTGGSRDRTG